MKWDFRSTISGARRGPLAMLARLGLRLASLPYGWAVSLRNRKYDSGKLPIHECGVPVISVGNLTTGGTGKTPIVCYLAKQFRNSGIRVAIVSRGYGRGDADQNDEAMELHARLPDVPHVQDPDRVEAARVAVEELEAQVILMDDGFQHRRLHRDENLVVIDATCPFGYGYVLPRGLLRESVNGLSRADAVLITRCDAVSEADVAAIESRVREHTDAAIIRSHHAPLHLLEHPAEQFPIETLKGQRIAIVCAIGNPDAFQRTVTDCGATVVATRFLGDHDEYSPETMKALRTWVQSLGDTIDCVVCTHKDLVKIRADRIGGKPIRAILIDLQVVGDERPLLDVIQRNTV